MADRLESRSGSHGSEFQREYENAVPGTNSFASALRVKAFTVVSREKPLSSPVKVGGTHLRGAVGVATFVDPMLL